MRRLVGLEVNHDDERLGHSYVVPDEALKDVPQQQEQGAVKKT